MTMWNAEGREADAKREAEEAEEARRRRLPIPVKTLYDFPDEPHWVIMTFDILQYSTPGYGRSDPPDSNSFNHVTYTAFLSEVAFKDEVRALKMIGKSFKAFHVDAIAKVSVEISIK